MALVEMIIEKTRCKGGKVFEVISCLFGEESYFYDWEILCSAGLIIVNFAFAIANIIFDKKVSNNFTC